MSADGKERVISFAAKPFTTTERKYPQTQREALGITWGVEHETVMTIQGESGVWLTTREIETETGADPELTAVIQALETGIWPDNIKSYRSIADQLEINSGLLTTSKPSRVKRKI